MPPVPTFEYATLAPSVPYTASVTPVAPTVDVVLFPAVFLAVIFKLVPVIAPVVLIPPVVLPSSSFNVNPLVFNVVVLPLASFNVNVLPDNVALLPAIDTLLLLSTANP